MQLEEIKSTFLKYKETSLFHRYITNNHIEPLIKNLSKFIKINEIGKSVLKVPIYSLQIGDGNKRILMWSQMHGNESTTTKAIFDLLNALISNDEYALKILEKCSITIIPILNPDGAKAYTRINANEVDLNRDAQNLTQPESRILRTIFEEFKPHFCFNLHGQRTIFSVGNLNKPATVSFLAPAQDQKCSITPNRMIAMEVISEMNKVLQLIIPGQVGVYDDTFNLNCVGDTFQSKNVPTILFEAGHFENDYSRDNTREFIYISYITALNYISKSNITGSYYKPYFNIPENGKCFYDVIIRNTKLNNDSKTVTDIGFLFHEKLVDDKILFVPKVDVIGKLDSFYGHKEIQANNCLTLNEHANKLEIGSENVFVIINNEKISLFSK